MASMIFLKRITDKCAYWLKVIFEITIAYGFHIFFSIVTTWGNFAEDSKHTSSSNALPYGVGDHFSVLLWLY
jgi:hypothetical protein